MSQVIKLANSLRWLVCGNGSYGCDDIQTFEHGSKDNVLIIELGARPGPSGDQEFHVPVRRVKLDFVVVVVFGERERNDAGSRMREREGLGVDGFGVARQVVRRPDLALVGAALAAGEEVLAGKDPVDEGVLVGGRGGVEAQTHGFKVGDCDGNEVPVEAQYDAAQ